MNHQWFDEKGSWSSSGPAKADEENFPMRNAGVMLAQQQENFPMWNAGGVLAQRQSSSSSGPAQKADEVNFQVQGHNSSVFLGKGTGADGNFCGVGGIVDGKIPGQMPQFVEVVNDPSLSGAHPMYERPRVVEGPYAPIKTKKGQKGFDDNSPDDEERTRRAEYEDLKVRLESTYRQKVAEVNRKGREVSEQAYIRMNQAYELLQRRSEVDRLEIANESAAMRQCIQDLESQATLKNVVVEYQASTYVEKHKLEAQAREAEQQQEVRMFEQRTMMEALLQARDRDVELRAKFESEMAERQQRADAEARRTIEVEKQRVMFADQLQMQDLQAKVAHYEALAVRTQRDLEQQQAQAAEELRRMSQVANVERNQYCTRVDNEVKEL
jgi:hypothetical protein